VRKAVLLSAMSLLGCVPKSNVDCLDDACAIEPWEIIVVGSGAGGGPLASRLAREGRRVLLIEAGTDVGGKLEYQVPAMHAISTEDPELAWWYFVGHHADEALDRQDSKWTEAGVLYPRGSALGGSTAVNAMVTVLPSPSDWNRLAAITGDTGFRASSMARYVDRVEEWLSVELPDPALASDDPQISRYLAAAASAHHDERSLGEIADPLEWLGSGGELSRLLLQDVNQSLKGGEASGLFRLPLATKDGVRNGTRERILSTVEAGHPLTVMTGTFVTKVIFADDTEVPTAIGVEVVEAERVYGASLAQRPAPAERRIIRATREVILAAGAFNTPQILMLSGIGDASQLANLGIAPILDRPGVGKNLQDRYEAPVVTQLPEPIATVEPCRLSERDPNDPCLDDWRSGRGVYETSGFLASVLRRSPGSALADLQVFGVPGDARGYYPGYSLDGLRDKDRFTWLLLKAHTANHDGEVRLESADPFRRPKIRFNSYDETAPLADPDLLALVDGVRFVRRIADGFRRTTDHGELVELWPGPDVRTDEDLARFIRKESWGHHACCSNAMGRADDPRAVIDSRFRVIGAERLRVVDASSFPEIPGTFIAYPIYLLSERAADLVLEDL
jgi:choline dehydrogenase